VGGWNIKPLANGNSELTYFTESDIKGSIPGFIKKQVNKDQGNAPLSLKKSFEKFRAEHF